MTRYWLGKRLSLETKRKISLSKKGSVPWNKGIKQWAGKKHPRLDKKHSLEARKKMSISHKGQVPWNRGKWEIKKCKNCGKEIISGKDGVEKIFCSKVCANKYFGKLHAGSNHHNWKGGISKTKEYRATKSKEWVSRNKDYKRFLNLQRVNIKRSAFGSHTFEQWQELKIFYNNMCLCCKRPEPDIKLSEDHIIPLSKGGSDNIENIQPLCKNCNSKKYTNSFNYRKEVVFS